MLDLHCELSRHAVTEMLKCPVCSRGLRVSEGGASLVCDAPRAHCFDGAAGGYVSLSPRHSGGGDGKEAVRYRSAFLSKGYYQPVADTLVTLLGALLPADAAVVDAGCGEGYYSNRISAAGYTVVGVDLSKFAVDAAAKAARRARCEREESESHTLYAVGSVFDLPLRDGCADAVVNIFAPCAPAEYARVLRTGGCLIVASAGEDHLLGLKKCVYDDPYLNDPRRDLPDEGSELVLEATRHVHFDITVPGGDDLKALFSMTPYYWRTSPAGHERLAAAARIETPVSVDLHIYRKKLR